MASSHTKTSATVRGCIVQNPLPAHRRQSGTSAQSASFEQGGPCAFGTHVVADGLGDGDGDGDGEGGGDGTGAFPHGHTNGKSFTAATFHCPSGPEQQER